MFVLKTSQSKFKSDKIDRKGRLLPPRPNDKVRNKIGGGGRNKCVKHTTKRQKSRVGQESWLNTNSLFYLTLIYITFFY